MDKKSYISQKELYDYENSTGAKKRELETKIIENIITNLLRFEDIPLASSSELRVVYGNVTGNAQKDAIFIVKIGPKNTIVVVYERTDSVYKFKGLVNNFMEIKDVKTAKVTGNSEEIIMLFEHIEQMIGAFETSTILRAYRWNLNKFEQILEAQKDYKSYWNELYDNKKPKDKSHWLKIEQLANADNNDNERIHFKINQKYQRSRQVNSVDIPNDDDFQVLSERKFSKLYYWNNKWKHYILGEGVEIYTGLIVAILENLEQEPFSLIEGDERYKIKRLDGEISVVDKNTIQSEL